MKILYIGTDAEGPLPLVDYQNDCLLIGLKELLAMMLLMLSEESTYMQITHKN